MVDRGPAGAGAGEDLIQFLRGDFDVLVEVYRKFLVKAVDDKIKQVLFLYLAVCFGLLHTLPKQTLPLIRCDRLSLVIGVVWAVWHLPLFVFGVQGYGGRSFALYAVLVMGFSIILTWLYNNTGGGILMAMLLHGGINTASSLGGMFVGASAGESLSIFVAYGVPAWVVAAVLLLWFGRATLSRGSAVTVFSDRGTNGSEQSTVSPELTSVSD